MKIIIFVFIIVWFILLIIRESKKLLKLENEKKKLINDYKSNIEYLKSDIEEYQKRYPTIQRLVNPDKKINFIMNENYKIAHLKWTYLNSENIKNLKYNDLKRFKSRVIIYLYLTIVIIGVLFLWYLFNLQ